MPFVGSLLCHQTSEPNPLILLDREHWYEGKREAKSWLHGSQLFAARTPHDVWRLARDPDRLHAVLPDGYNFLAKAAQEAPGAWIAALPAYCNFAVARITYCPVNQAFVILIDPRLLARVETLQAIPSFFALPNDAYILRIAPEFMAEVSRASGRDKNLCELHPDWEQGCYTFVACHGRGARRNSRS